MIFNLDTFLYLAHAPHTALGCWERTRGMIGRRFDAGRDAMVFPRCAAIHTLFMGMRIDVLFLDRENRVVGAYGAVGPWRPLLGCRGAATTVELPEGTLERSGTRIGHRINLNSELTAEAIAKLRCRSILYEGDRVTEMERCESEP